MEVYFWILTLTPVLSLLSYAALLVIVSRRAARSQLQRAFALYLVVMAMWSLGSAMMRLDPERILFWNKVLTGSGMVTPLAFFLFVVTFLDQKRSRWLQVGIVILVGLQVANAFDLMVIGANLQEGGLISFEVGPAGYAATVYGLLYYTLSVVLLVAAYRRTPEPVRRNRIRYLLLGVFVVVLGGSTNMVPSLGPFPVDHGTNLLNALLLTYAVLRYQLADITLVVRKGLLYSIPTAIIGAGYFLAIWLVTTLFRALTGLQILLISLLVAAIAAIATQPLRDRAQLWIDRLFFREKYDARLMLQRLSHTAASVLELDRLTNMILDGITTTMHIGRAAFFLKQQEGGEFRLTAHRGLDPNADMRLRGDHPLVDWLSRHEDALTHYEMDMIPQFKALWAYETEALQRLRAELFVPLKAKGDLVGILTIGPKLSGEAYSQDDQLTLITLANQTATALENARLHEETRRRYRELALLNRVIAASATSRNTESLLKRVCHELASALGELQAVAVLLNEERTEAIILTPGDPSSPTAGGQAGTLVAFLAESGSWPADPTIPLECHERLQCLLGPSAPLILDDAWTDPRLGPIVDSVRQHGITSLLSLPLLVEGKTVGLICLAAIKPHPFTAEEVDLAQRAAEQVSGAMARIRLAEIQQRLTTAVEQAAEAVMITDTDGTILYVNPAFEHVSGYGHAEVVGHGPAIFKSGRQDDLYYRQLWQTIADGEVWQGRLVNKKKDGSLYTVDTTITPVRDRSGKIFNFVATMRDVTREIQLEQQFYQSQKMEALGRLAGGIAHDFNNLLTILNLNTRLLQRRMNSDDALWEYVERIDETGERAAKLTKQLLSFSRREVIELQVVDLNRLVSDLSQMLQRVIGEDVRLVTNLAEDLWSVQADPQRLEQMIINLAVNARDAMPQGGTLTIETAKVFLDEAYVARNVDAQPGKHTVLVVRDTGIGMGDEVKAHLFEPFFTTKPRGQGTGLGLSTAFGIVKQSQGHIQVESEVGRGTEFKIFLPCTEQVVAETAPPAMPPSTVRGTEMILVVEDEVGLRELVIRTLRAQGYQVLAASDGQEALELSRKHDGSIELLLTDVVMPRMDGRELARQLQPERPEMQVLYCSGYVDRPFVQEFASDPHIAFLPKPFSPETLIEKVRMVLDAPA